MNPLTSTINPARKGVEQRDLIDLTADTPGSTFGIEVLSGTDNRDGKLLIPCSSETI